MVDVIDLSAEAREEFGKGAARRIRRADKVPAVLYANGHEPVHVTLQGHESMLALRQANALLNVKLPDGTEQLALPKQVVRHPVSGNLVHVDLLMVFRGERVSVQVPVVIIGEAVPDALVNTERNEITLNAEATNIPSRVEVSIEGLQVGSQIMVGDIALPEGAELDDDPEALVVSINAAASVEDMLETGEEAEEVVEEPEAAEGESEE
ncbi:50S ribosomal protein L25/general stress protein Ctc [Propionimicrobium sp. PCR01-08-3]|uniref:50S ribosomal protein L25/general stress protein Ctc n=1 Tax=Propionimicrobium sp. PCR01-08-3 TaxID=3052086 RepID=UPI00255D0CED|nr:50S ribosomal protein L25/general stress protein Ctc [Propionimicrobium sp. PCR01-08-3]WIY83028.1 50S ribosomal protein L25/general stress protein Ctc [Propionimicrobium sp. PCR01-08-3]